MGDATRVVETTDKHGYKQNIHRHHFSNNKRKIDDIDSNDTFYETLTRLHDASEEEIMHKNDEIEILHQDLFCGEQAPEIALPKKRKLKQKLSALRMKCKPTSNKNTGMNTVTVPNQKINRCEPTSYLLAEIMSQKE